MPATTRDYLPRPDTELDGWAENLRSWVETNHDLVGLTDLDYEAIKIGWVDFHNALAAHTTARAAAESARQEKDRTRRALEEAVRPRIRIAQAFPGTTDAHRAAMGITIPDPTATPAAPPTTRPSVSIAIPARLTHTLRLSDESSPTRRAKPPGIAGAEVWLALADAGEPVPTDPAVLRYLTRTSRPTLRTAYPAADGGKTAVYMLRWVNTRGEKGPWSEAATATIAA
jgi:hypothetical protein